MERTGLKTSKSCKILVNTLQEQDLHLREDTEQTLKYLLNIKADELEEIPQQVDEINSSFIKRQFPKEKNYLQVNQLIKRPVGKTRF